MSDSQSNDGHRQRQDLEQKIATKEERKLLARRKRDRTVWFGLGMFGLVGWSVVVPALVGIAIGLWIDRRWPSPISWTLTLLIIGVALGCFNAWRWINREGGSGNEDEPGSSKND